MHQAYRQHSQKYGEEAAKEIYAVTMQGYERLLDPPRLKADLLHLLTYLWEEHFITEWVRVEPILTEAVSALSRIDTHMLSPLEAMQNIIGRDLSTVFIAEELTTFNAIEFIPSRHNGPYITWFGDNTTLRIVFGARIPTQVRQGTGPLDHVEFINQLKAMGDDTRLKILLRLHQEGELYTAELMDIFALNKSAASRHLRSLHASGLIYERRDNDNKTKFYSVNTSGVQAMIAALHMLLD